MQSGSVESAVSQTGRVLQDRRHHLLPSHGRRSARESGPYAKKRVYDPIIQGLSGFADLQAEPNTRRPQMIRTIVADKTTPPTAEPKVCRLPAGGNWIRNFSSVLPSVVLRVSEIRDPGRAAISRQDNAAMGSAVSNRAQLRARSSVSTA